MYFVPQVHRLLLSHSIHSSSHSDQSHLHQNLQIPPHETFSKLNHLSETEENQLHSSLRLSHLPVQVSCCFSTGKLNFQAKLCSWLPFSVFCILTEMFDFLTDEMIMVWFSVFHLVGMSSTCTNPVLYGFLNESISQEIMNKIRKLGHHLQVNEPI